MAILSFEELVECIKLHPRYKEFEKGTPPEHALCIRFSEEKTSRPSELFNLADGSELYLDIRDDGVAVAIEIA